MKKNYFYLFLILSTINTFGQCPFNNTFYLNLTPATSGATASDPCTWGGDLVTVDVIMGETYIVSLCNSTGFEDSQMTLYNAAGTVVLGYSDDFCGVYSEVTWLATYTGVLNVVIDEYNCISATNCMNLDITWENNLATTSFNNKTATIYPNPASESINFENFIGKWDVRVYDINGRLLLTEKVDEGRNSINISNLRTGIYQVEMINENEKMIKRIIKE